MSRALIRSLALKGWTLPEGDWQKDPENETLALACALETARNTALTTQFLRQLVEASNCVPASLPKPVESLSQRQAASRERAAEAYRKAGGTMDLGESDTNEDVFYETMVNSRRNTGLRLYWAVHYLGVKSFEQMARLKESELSRQKGVGVGALQLAKQLLAERGLSFAPES